jgi:hypothetical protein
MLNYCIIVAEFDFPITGLKKRPHWCTGASGTELTLFYIPIHKGGSMHNLDNYRGITLASNVYKVYYASY